MKNKEDKKQNKNPTEESLLENKWWHRLIKVTIYLSTAFTFILICVDSWGDDAITLFPIAFLYSLLLYLILNIFYYRVVLYIVYGNNKYTNIWSIKKIGIFILALALLFSLIITIEETVHSQKFSKPQKEEKDDLMEKIKIESINTKEEGSEYCKRGLYFKNECVNKISTKGKFVIVEVSLKNISKKPVLVSWGLSTLIDGQNREFEEWDYEGYDLWAKQKISPGFSETKQGIYEVPKNSNPEKINISFPSLEDKTIELNKK